MTPSLQTPRRERGSGFLASFAEAARRLLELSPDKRPRGGLGRAGHAGKAAEVMVPVCAFQMVGLEEVRTSLAARWPELAEKVHATAQAIIGRHLVRGDVFERRGDDGYLVLFASLGPKEAEFKSRVIAREIVERLLGEGETQRLNVTARCANVSADALASGDCEMAVDMALAQSAHEPVDPAVEPPSASFSPSGRTAAASLLRSYTPVWDTEQMTLLRFRGYIPRDPPGAPEDRAREAVAFQQDLAVVRAVAGDLQILDRQHRRLPTTIAIDHASLGVTSQRAALRHALSSIPPALRKFVTLEVCGPQEAFWTYSCKAFLEMTKPLGIGWSALLPLEQTQLIPAAGTLKVVATDLGGMAAHEAQALVMLTAFADAARAQGLESCVYGLTSRALVLGAVAAGFRYVAGPAIHADVTGLASAVRFEPLDLYADMARAPPPR